MHTCVCVCVCVKEGEREKQNIDILVSLSKVKREIVQVITGIKYFLFTYTYWRVLLENTFLHCMGIAYSVQRNLKMAIFHSHFRINNSN